LPDFKLIAKSIEVNGLFQACYIRQCGCDPMERDKNIQILDVSGHKCPVPVLRLRRKLAQLAVGERIEVRATDPMTQLDIPHFCQQAGHVLLSMDQDADIYCYLVKKTQEASD